MAIKKYDRRSFIGDVAKMGAAGLLPVPEFSLGSTGLFATKPYLQNVTPQGATIMWITAKPCKSWVEYGPSEAADHQAVTAHLGLIDANNLINKIKLTGLQPNTKYYYRVCSQEITEFKPYQLQWGETEKSDLFHFTTPEANPDTVSWVVLNDIHDRPASFPLLMSLVKDVPREFVFLNGDMFDYETDQQQMIDHLLNPLGELFSTETPFLFARGNHETRGKGARDHTLYFENLDDRYYFSFTRGPVHFVVLDTGEDKEDSHKEYGGLVAFDAYREEQARWLAKEIETPAFKKAPFRVVMMHIPPFESGDWHGTMHCRELFNPLFNKGKIDLMICGHTHRYGVFAADPATHNYPLVIGGGPLVTKRTVMTVKADRKELRLLMIREDGVNVGDVRIKSRL
ncbi:MAG: metallophosphoesterase family protein [Bacteroidetes bacterium]|nr:metallophosphoesterase family protein [Bacteroidota bacterium]